MSVASKLCALCRHCKQFAVYTTTHDEQRTAKTTKNLSTGKWWQFCTLQF